MPSRGSTLRHVQAAIHGALSATGHLGTRAVSGRRVRSGSRKRPAYEHTNGEFWSRGVSTIVQKEQLIDRENDHYLEHVVNSVTGEVLRHQDGRLSDHKGHGSDRKR